MGAAPGGGCGWGVWGQEAPTVSHSLWPGLGWSHLAGLRLGSGGRGVVISQWILAAAESSEHAVPELEDKRLQSGQALPFAQPQPHPQHVPSLSLAPWGSFAKCMLPFNQRHQVHR